MRIAFKRRQSKKSYRKNILGVYFDDNLTTFLETLKVAKESYRIGYCHDSLVNFENLNLIYPVEKVTGGVSISWRNVLKTTSSDLPLEGIVFVAMVLRLSLMPTFIQTSLNSLSTQEQILSAACQKLTTVRTSGNVSDWEKYFLDFFCLKRYSQLIKIIVHRLIYIH